MQAKILTALRLEKPLRGARLAPPGGFPPPIRKQAGGWCQTQKALDAVLAVLAPP